MRGWPAVACLDARAGEVFPAHAGMARSDSSYAGTAGSVPRACGDGPRRDTSGDCVDACSPRMRGWPAGDDRAQIARRVFPAHAGMARLSGLLRSPCSSVPRACGDGPPCREQPWSSRECSPRMRGWPGRPFEAMSHTVVFPAHAGMARFQHQCSRPDECVPRACGDGPAETSLLIAQQACSPRMRGWPAGRCAARDCRTVFPAHAGMARIRHCGCTVERRVPRACGDGPPLQVAR